MSDRIVYSEKGNRTYFRDGKEVTEAVFWNRSKDNLQEMFAEQQAPYGVSDCTFMRGTANGSQFEGQQKIGNSYKMRADAEGVSITGKKYISGLAAYPGDPEAWVDSRGDVQKLLGKRGWGAEGTINVKPRDMIGEIEKPAVSEDLVNKYTNQVADQLPDPHLVDRQHLKEQVRERISPPKYLRRKKAK